MTKIYDCNPPMSPPKPKSSPGHKIKTRAAGFYIPNFTTGLLETGQTRFSGVSALRSLPIQIHCPPPSPAYCLFDFRILQRTKNASIYWADFFAGPMRTQYCLTPRVVGSTNSMQYSPSLHRPNATTLTFTANYHH